MNNNRDQKQLMGSGMSGNALTKVSSPKTSIKIYLIDISQFSLGRNCLRIRLVLIWAVGVGVGHGF